MKNLLKKITGFATLTCLMTIGINTANAQIGMNGNNPDKSAALDLNATNKGLLVPRVNLSSLTDKASINGGNPATSLMIFNTNTSLGIGFFYWDGSTWKKLITGGDVSGDNLGNHTATQNLNMSAKDITNAANITATAKTTTNTLAVAKGSDNNAPAVGSIATAADVNGNLIWKPVSSVVDGSQTKVTAGTNVTVSGTGTTASPYVVNATSTADNLGNHTATQDLNMNSKNINNINAATVGNGIVVKDRTTSNTNSYTLYKNTGLLALWSDKNNGNDFQVDESNRRTGVNNMSIYRGTDGSVPAANAIATSADANGNVVWKSVSSLVDGSQTKVTAGTNVTVSGTGTTASPYVVNATSTADNLGNHTATQNLNMSAKDITNAANITATAKTTTNTLAVAKGSDNNAPAVGSIATAADVNGNLIWKPVASVVDGSQTKVTAGTNVTVSGTGTTASPYVVNATSTADNLGNHTATQNLNMSAKDITNAANITATAKTTTNTLAVAKGSDNAAPAAGYIATAADANGNVVWKSASSIGAGDNLGNHTATTTLNMATNRIDNIKDAYFKDQTVANTNNYALWKNNGVFGMYSSKNAANDFQVDEATRKTTVNNVAISKGTDGSVPAVGSLAVANSTTGDLVWKTPASVVAANQVQSDWNMATTTDPAYIKNKPTIPAADNLGNHTATMNVNLNGNAINNSATTDNTKGLKFDSTGNANFQQNVGVGTATPKGKLSINAGQLSFDQLADGDKIWFLGDTNQSKIGTETGWTISNYAGATTNASTGKYSWKTIDANKAWAERMSLDNSGSLTIANKLDAQQAKIAKGTDGAVPAAGYIATAADANGNVVWKSASSIGAGDNLGNHTATADLQMSNKSINNIYAATVNNELFVKDRTAANTNTISLYKKDGVLNIFDSKTSTNNLTIDETSHKTGVNNLSIYRGTDGSVPAANAIATSADASGNVVWKSVSSLVDGSQTKVTAGTNVTVSGTGTTASPYVVNATSTADNLGNHTATQNLNMSAKDITAAANITATAKTTTNTLAVAKGSDNNAPAVGSIATAADVNGNLIWKPVASVVDGSQTKVTAGTNVTVSGAGTTASPYVVNATSTADNLGNHTATTTLNMATNRIDNIKDAYFKDQTAGNNNNYAIWKNNGVFGFYSSKNSANDLSVDESNRKTTANNIAITKGTDGSVPAANSIATSADANGNVVWKSVSSLVDGSQTKVTAGTNVTVSGAGTTASPYVVNATSTADNLGNHTATQNLNMSAKDITAAANITATAKTTTNTLAVAKGSDNNAPAVGSIATAADVNGNLIWKPVASVVDGSQTKVTAGTNVTVSGAGTTASPYVVNATSTADNLGNHTATKALDMASYNINNINAAYIKDGNTGNTNTYGLYKTGGVFGLYSSKNAGNDLLVDENTRKTTVNNVAITKGTDASVPAAGSIAVSADASGNVVWKAPSAVGIGTGWNLTGNAGTNASSNFVGTTDNVDLAFRTNNTEKVRLTSGGNLGIGTNSPKGKLSINAGQLSFDQLADSDKIWMFGDAARTKIGTEGGYKLTNYAGYTGDPSNGQFSWKTVDANKAWAEKMSLDNSGSLTVANKIVAQQAQIKAGTDGKTPQAGYVATAADNNGNVNWIAPAMATGSVSGVWDFRGTTKVDVNAGETKAIPMNSTTFTLPKAAYVVITYSALPVNNLEGTTPVQGSIDLIIDNTKSISSYFSALNQTGWYILGNYSTSQYVVELAAGTHTIGLQVKNWAGAQCSVNPNMTDYAGATASDSQAGKSRISVIAFNK